MNSLVKRLRADAKAIREHVPDDDCSLAVVAASASDPARRTVAGPLHAEMLSEAADALEEAVRVIRMLAERKLSNEPEIDDMAIFPSWLDVCDRHDAEVRAARAFLDKWGAK